jgi:hypothetical protein
VSFNTPLGRADRFRPAPPDLPALGSSRRTSQVRDTLPPCLGSNCSLDKDRARAYPPWSRRGIIPMCDGLSTSRFRFFHFFCGPGGMNSGRNLKALLLSPCIFQYYTLPVVVGQVQSPRTPREKRGAPPKPPPPADKYYSAFADHAFSASWAVRCSGSPWRPREGRSGATARIPPFCSRNSLTLGPTLSCWKHGSGTD